MVTVRTKLKHQIDTYSKITGFPRSLLKPSAKDQDFRGLHLEPSGRVAADAAFAPRGLPDAPAE